MHSFFSAHAAAPLCAPSRFSILTGQPASCAASSSALRALTEKATQLMANMGGAETEVSDVRGASGGKGKRVWLLG
jgi:hypothetical protein